MKTNLKFVPFLALFTLAVATASAHHFEEVTREAADIFNAKQRSADPIPAAVLARAEAIGIVKVTEAGLGLGASAGEGVVVARTPRGWSAPAFFHQSGGSLGLQFGVQAKRYIYVFNASGSVSLFTGPETSRFRALAQLTQTGGHESKVAYDETSNRPLLVYTDAKGVYAGASMGGVQIGGSADENRAAYGTDDARRILGGEVPVPSYAEPLRHALAQAASLPEGGK